MICNWLKNEKTLCFLGGAVAAFETGKKRENTYHMCQRTGKRYEITARRKSNASEYERRGTGYLLRRKTGGKRRRIL